MGANPTGLPRKPRRDLYYFIHNVYAHFFKDTLDYFSAHLVPSSKYRMISTYDKALIYIKQQCDQEGREMDRANLPAIMINPSGEFIPADALSLGKQLWRFPNLAPGMVKRIFEPVYKDAHTQVHVDFMRIMGEMEVLILVNSFYEYADIRMLLLNIFGGFDRWIYPQYFTTFIIIPQEMIDYTYTNEYAGLSYQLDWESAGAYDHLVRTTNQNELVIPCNIKPVYKLTGIGDVSTRYGGTDDIAEWKLQANISYEIEIPNFLVLESDYLLEKIKTEIYALSTYSVNNSYEPPGMILNKTFTKHWGIDATSNDTLDFDGECDIETKQYKFRSRYYHVISQSEVDSTGDLIISIPEQVINTDSFIVASKYGEMDYGSHYEVINNGYDLIIKREYVDLEEGMIIELFIYN